MIRPTKRKKQKMGVRENPGPMRSEGHRRYIRSLESIVPYDGPPGDGHRIECAHVDFWESVDGKYDVPIEDRGSKGNKYGDNWTIPLAAALHKEWTDGGGKSFCRKYKINPHRFAVACALSSPHKLDFIRDRDFR